MGRRPLKKPAPKPSKSPPRRRSSSIPQPSPAPPTPPRSIPLNFLLRALTTPPRPPSHHPFLCAFSTPLRRRSEYSPLVRRLCQKGAYDRLPYDNEAFVNKVLPCEGCQKTGMMTQNIAFKQGHAGEWVRVCQNSGCKLIYYPAQPGTPPNLLQEIESARETGAQSSTVATPDSGRTRSSASFSTPSQDLDIAPSIGGQLEDWLSPLFRDLDMEAAAMTSTLTPSDSGSLEPVAGPSTGSGLSSIRDVPPRCARDEEIARMMQVAADEEDAILLQQLEVRSPADASPAVSDSGQEPATLSSLTAELATITGSRPVQPEPSSAAAPALDDDPASRCTSRESSPSPRPRKKKRIIVPPSPFPPRVKRKIYGPIPAVPKAKAKTYAKIAKPAKPGAAVPNAKPPSKLPVKASTQQSDADATTAARPHGDAPLPLVIVISSDEERAPPARPVSGADESDVIDITSSDSDNDAPPRRTQSDSPRPRATQGNARISPPATQAIPRGRARNARTPPPATQPIPRGRARNARTPPPATQPIPRGRARNARTPPLASQSRSRAKPHKARTPPSPSPSRSPRPRAKPHKARPPRSPSRSRSLRSRPEARNARSPRVADESDVINITSSESDGDTPLPATQPRIARSRAPSRDVTEYPRPTHSGSESDSAPPDNQPRAAGSQTDFTSRDLPMRTRALPTAGSSLPDSVEAGSSNKENAVPAANHSCLDFRVSRLPARQVSARRRLGLFASLAQTSSSSSSVAAEFDDDVSHVSDATDRPVAESNTTNVGERVDASVVFGDPFRFEVYPAIPGLATNTDATAEKRHWVLTVKLWYKNNTAPSTKLIPLDFARCSIRLSDVFIVARAFHFVGVTNARVWNRFTTDWETRSLYDHLPVSVADNHTLLIRLPTVATLSSWAENVSLAYGSCQTVDPRPAPSRKGKERAYD